MYQHKDSFLLTFATCALIDVQSSLSVECKCFLLISFLYILFLLLLPVVNNFLFPKFCCLNRFMVAALVEQ